MATEKLIQQIFESKNGEVANVISELRNHRYIPIPDVERARHALDIKEHDINSQIIRPDKRVMITSDNAENKVVNVDAKDQDGGGMRIEKVARVSLALQQLIINRAVSFTFGNPVLYNCTPEDDAQKQTHEALKRILYDVKSTSLNRRIARSLYGFKEVAELWYPVEAQNERYGFKSKFKLKCAIFSPAYGDKLYPFFDETGDMVAFSREFSRSVDATEMNTKNYFESWTADEHYLFVQDKEGYQIVEGYPKDNPIGKIPVIYAHQTKFETEDVDKLIDRLESLLSNFADTNDYHASPKIFTTGEIKSFGKKGEAGAIIEGEEGATMQYVSWANAPEAVKLEIETLLKMIFTITQTPDISWDSVKGLNVSGVALKLLFMDAHLKVQDKREVLDEYLQRRVNVILPYIGMFNTKLAGACGSIAVEPEIQPYMINDDLNDLQYWLTANGNLPVISHEESIEKAGLSSDPTKTVERITEETAKRNTFNFGEATLDA